MCRHSSRTSEDKADFKQLYFEEKYTVNLYLVKNLLTFGDLNKNVLEQL